jgi:acyl carrier protein
MNMRSKISSTFVQVAEQQGRALATLRDELHLADCGLDSIGFVLVVSSLELSLGFDPFDSEDMIDFPVTLGEFIRLYEQRCPAGALQS